MVVTGFRPVNAGWCNTHARETKQDLKRIGDSVSVRWTYDIYRGIRRSGGLSKRVWLETTHFQRPMVDRPGVFLRRACRPARRPTGDSANRGTTYTRNGINPGRRSGFSGALRVVLGGGAGVHSSGR